MTQLQWVEKLAGALKGAADTIVEAACTCGKGNIGSVSEHRDDCAGLFAAALYYRRAAAAQRFVSEAYAAKRATRR